MFKELPLTFLYYSQSFADGWKPQCHVWLPWQEPHGALAVLSHLSAFCAEQLCAPFDYQSKSCKFCLSQYLSLWGIFWFSFWAAFLLTSMQPFFGVWINGVQGGELQWLCPFLSCSWVAVTSQKLMPVRGSGVECDGWVPDVTETPDLIFCCLWRLEWIWSCGKEGEGVSHPLTMCHLCSSLGRQNAAGWILSS